MNMRMNEAEKCSILNSHINRVAIDSMFLYF